MSLREHNGPVYVPDVPLQQPRLAIVGTSRDLGCVHRSLAAIANVLGSEVSIILIDCGSEIIELSNKARELGIKIRFADSSPELFEALAEICVLIAPAPKHRIPSLVLEAMGAGVPVIAADAPDVGFVMQHHRSGFLIRGSQAEFEQCLSSLFSERGLRQCIAEEARRAAIARCGTSLWTTAITRVDHSVTSSAGLRSVGKRAVDAVVPDSLVRWRGKPARNEIALTFDDGPHPRFTPEVLTILRDYGVHATFFLLGNRAEDHPGIVESIAKDGHEIANHSYTHPYFSKLSMAEASLEIKAAEDAISRTGVPYQRLFRPPFGNFSVQALLAPWMFRHSVVFWNADLKDYRATSSAEIHDQLRATMLKAGDVLLYHGVTSEGVAALPKVLDTIVDNGNRACVTVSQCAS